MHDLFSVQLAHLVRMAQKPAFKAQAWHRAKELDADASGLFTGMARALMTAMSGPAEISASESPKQAKKN
jgi:hypothetical protein